MLRRRVLDVLAASLAAAGSSKEIAPPKCIKAEPPRVDATGRLTSGDLAGAFSTHGATLAHVAPNGSYYAKYDGAALRNAFAGRWLYFMGDSSLRGVVLAFLMQLQSFAGTDYVERGSGGRGDELIVRRWMADRDGCVLARPPPAERFRDTLTAGWTRSSTRRAARSSRYVAGATTAVSHGRARSPRWTRAAPSPGRGAAAANIVGPVASDLRTA